jgi:hypothetical protein
MTSAGNPADQSRSSCPRRSNLTSPYSPAWALVMDRAELLGDRLEGAAHTPESLLGLVSQLRACPSRALDEHSQAAAELSELIEQAHQLLELDPGGRDPFWALRNVLSDIARGLTDVLDQFADPLFSSDEGLENYLASAPFVDVARGLGDILEDQDDQARRRLVAALAYRLARSRDPDGIVTWFRTPRSQLGNRSPVAVLEGERGEAARMLLPLAGGGSQEGALRLVQEPQSP